MSVILKITLTSFLFSLLFLFIVDFKKSKQGEIEPIRMSVSNQIPKLLEGHVKISNPKLVDEKLIKLSRDGKDKLQVISDFDKTLTKSYLKDGKPSIGSLEIIRVMSRVPESIKQQYTEIMIYFSSILKNLSMTDEDKIIIIDGIYEELGNTLTQIPFVNSSYIEEEAANNRFCMRDGVEESFALLKEGSVPVTIISAGIGHVIDYLLKISGINSKDVHVIANYLSISDGRVTGFADRVIQVYNKDNCMQNTSYFKGVSDRKNLVVLGDMLLDANMSNNILESSTVLKIGFLNINSEEELQRFMEVYDIVIVEDQSMEVVNAILRYVL